MSKPKNIEALRKKAKEKVDQLAEGNVLEIFKKVPLDRKTLIIRIFLRAYRKFDETRYITIIENLLDELFELDEWEKQDRLMPSDKTQAISAFFADVLLRIYDITRINKYLELARLEYDFLMSSDRARIKERGNLSYDQKGKSIRAENAYYIYPFWVRMAIIGDDELSVAKGLNEFFALHHQLWDSDAKLYHSKFRKRLFRYKFESKKEFSTHANAIFLAAIVEMAEILEDMVGMRRFKSQLGFLKKMGVKLALTLIDCADKSYSDLIPEKIIPEKIWSKSEGAYRLEDMDLTATLLVSESSLRLGEIIGGDSEFNNYKVQISAFNEKISRKLSKLEDYVKDPRSEIYYRYLLFIMAL